MASKELSILLTAKDLASRTIGNVGRNVKKLDSISSRAGQGMRNLGTSLKRMAAIGAGAGIGLLAVSVKSGIESLASLETAISSVQGAIDTMGQSSRISGKQVAAWANDIEAATGAAFDDKDITAATANLIRYGNIAPRHLQKVMVVMTDLAAKNGDVEAASKAMAKALADPTKATRLLKDAGVVLSKQEQKRITDLVKSGRVHKAQAILIDLVAEKTKGAALASQGPYARSLATMQDAVEDAQRALGEGFLPVIQRVADWLKKGLADPGTMSNIRTLGQNLADAFDNAVTFAQGIDWNGIGAGLKVAADWAKRLFDAFNSMPAEVKGTLIALAGLDRLSGGAVSGIVGELGKGLIKGVLGMTAGVVNINAGVVNGGGGLPGGKGGGNPAGKIIGGAGLLSTAAAGATIVGGMLLAKEALLTWVPAAIGTKKGGDEAGAMRGVFGGTKGGQNVPSYMEAQIGALLANAPGMKAGAPKEAASDAKEHNIRVVRAIDKSRTDTRAEQLATTRGVEAVKAEQAKSLVAFRSGERTSATGLSTVASTTRVGDATVAAAQSSSASRIVGAVQAAGKPTVIVNVTVPGAKVTYGSSSGSSGRTSNPSPNGTNRPG